MALAVVAAVALSACGSAFAADGKMAREGNADMARRLINAGADVNARNDSRDGYTALHLAARERHVDVAKVLIEAGADVNAKGDNGITALWVAENNGHADVADLLRETRAKE